MSNDSKINVYSNFDAAIGSSAEKYNDSSAKYFIKENELKHVDKNKYCASPEHTSELIQKYKSNDMSSKYYYNNFLGIENEKIKERDGMYESDARGCSDSESDDEIDIVGTQC